MVETTADLNKKLDDFIKTVIDNQNAKSMDALTQAIRRIVQLNDAIEKINRDHEKEMSEMTGRTQQEKQQIEDETLSLRGELADMSIKVEQLRGELEASGRF